MPPENTRSPMAESDDALVQRARRVMPELRGDPNATELARVPGFRLLRKVGAGGMGMVFEAEQEQPRRRVALKFLRPDRASPAALRRFEYEIRALGRLHHRGIAQIHAAGTAGGPDGPQPFIAMELVDGKPLLDHARQHDLDLHQRLALLIEICRAVHHAHQKGVIHRDLKPSNVLVAPDGQPKVLDFGVARVLDAEGELASAATVAGQLVGTVPYMSPEQLQADPEDLDVRSDVYTLGVVGFQLLSGRLPHDVAGRPVTDIVRSIAEDEPARLRTVAPELQGDLDVVFAKALERERDRRYPSADAFASDLERFLRNEPITARPPAALYQLRKFVARHRTLVVLAALAAGSLAIGAVVGVTQMLRALAAEATAESRRIEAEREARVTAATNDYLRLILDAAAPSAPGTPVTVLDAIEHAARGIDAIEDPLVEASVRDLVGSTYTSLERLADAGVHLERALALLEQHRQPPHPEIARCLNQLARLRTVQGDQDAAIALYRRSLAMYEELHGPNHETVGRTLANLAASLHAKAARGGKDLLEEARTLLERATAIGRGASRRQWLASSLGKLGGVEKDLGNQDRAAQLLAESLDVFASTPYDRDPIAGIVRINLGTIHAARGDHDAALALFREAHAVFAERLGPQHSYTKGALSWIAHTEAQQRERSR